MDFKRTGASAIPVNVPSNQYEYTIAAGSCAEIIPQESPPRPRSTTLDSGYQIELADFDESQKEVYKFPPVVLDPCRVEPSKKIPVDNYKGTVDSSTIHRLSTASRSDNTQTDLDGLSYGLRIRLSRSLQDTNRSSFANQVEQLSRRYSTLNESSSNTQLTAEISQPLSALYAILVVITGACLAFSSQLTPNLDSMYCRYFDSVLLSIGIVFLMTAFGYLYRKKASPNFPRKNSALPMICDQQQQSRRSSISAATFSGYFQHLNSSSHGADSSHSAASTSNCRSRTGRAAISDLDSASFYLKMGALAFAIGSMIYACLELGVFVENTSCFNTIMGLNPVLFMVFVVLQLYFVFLNSQLTLRKHRTIGRFGLMHLVATNLCTWIRTLIDETLHAFGKIREKSEKMVFLSANLTQTNYYTGLEYSQMVQDSKQGKGGYNPLCVDDESVMKKMMEEASVFLYPCIIEYSMISAGIIYIMWTIVEQNSESLGANHADSHRSRKTSYAVDCDQAAKGLFVGIIIVVLTIVSLILYFIFLEKPEFSDMAVLQAQITEIVLYGIGILAVIYCGVQIIGKLKRSRNHHVSFMLDATLLKISMVGVYGYSVVSILGGFSEGNITGVLSVVAAVLCLFQSSIQTIFIFEASQRVVCCASVTPDQKAQVPRVSVVNKPARETVTLLLIVNFALWATNVFCTLRAESSPSQNEFFGMHEWIVILHVTVPLVIFYRFHSTACLFEIWKRAYKVKRSQGSSAKAFPLHEYITTA